METMTSSTKESSEVQINIQDDNNTTGDNDLASMKTDSTHANDSATVPFVPSQLFHLARRTLEIADYYGEKLAYFFGITSPKYEAEIREYEKRTNEKRLAKEKETNEYSGWNGPVQQSNFDTSAAAVSHNPVVTFAPRQEPLLKY